MSKQILESGESALKSLVGHVTELTKLLNELKERPSALRKKFVKQLSGADELDNPELTTKKEQVEDITTETVELLNDMNVWIQLLLPKVESGGNFDVKVQLQFIAKVGSSIADVSKIHDTIASYHEKRAKVVAGLIKSEKIETTTSNTTKSVEEGKTGESEFKKRTVLEKVVSKSQYEALASVDVKLYLDLKEALRLQRDFLIVMQDYAIKNEKKLKKPKSLNESMPGFFM